MKNRFWITVLATTFIATTLRAAEPVTPDTSHSNVLAFAAGTTSNDIEYRHVFHDSQFAVIVLAGYQSISAKQTNPQFPPEAFSQHYTELGLGLRRNFSTGEQLRPFVQLSVIGDVLTTEQCSGDRAFNAIAAGGAEYFVGRRVSLEGSAGVELGKESSTCTSIESTLKTRTTTLNTVRAALGINFYF